MVDTLPPQQTCKKCHLAIIDGHAYELGEDRWHIHCFKCSKCDKSLGCNSNFLVLGNGSLICLSCLYNCKQCNKKIDDLAILTGDQAYCSNCFKCRVCKRKIEDLRYARTSKGLFCMSCHEELIAKKRKHDLKRKQLAQLSHMLRPSPDVEYDNLPLASVSSLLSDIYLLRNSSLTSMLNKLLPPHPSAPQKRPNGLVAEKAEATSPAQTSSPPQETTPTTPALAVMTPTGQAPPEVVPGLLPSDFNVQLPQLADISAQEIEEVNDSDDELNMRKMRERLERRFNRLTGGDSDGAILDLIYSFSGPNTPSTVYTTTDVDAVTSLHISLRKENDSSETINKMKEDPRRRPHQSLDPNSPQKNLLLLSPSQFHDNDFHKTAALSSDPLTLSAENIVRPRSAASSPMAKQNRQARVVETNDDILTSEINTDVNNNNNAYSRENKENEIILTTPKKAMQRHPVTSPPPRLALPEVPSTPRGEISEPKGLGLENVDLLRPSKPLGHPTPAVTNLEDTIPSSESINEQDFQRTPSRKQSVRSKILLKHKRSVSGGLNSGISGKFGFFKSKDDTPGRGHSRGVLEGSILGLAFTTPPLPLSNPMPYSSPGARQGVFRDNHTRSTSDTQFLTLMDDIHKGELDLRSLKFEIYQLDNRRQNLLAENMRLNTDKNKLQEAIKALQRRLTLETQSHDTLIRDVNDLTAEKLRLRQENEKLKDEIKHLSDSSTRIREHLREPTRNNHSYDASNEFYDSSTGLDSVAEEGETQKATRLKFWRRPRVTISPSINNIYQLQTSQLPSTSSSLGNGIPVSQSSHKLSQSYNSNAIQHPALQSLENGESGARKALNTFMSKSRSTNVLDVIANGGEVPLFSSTLQKRAIYENEKVPLIITRCLKEVEERGLDVEGIYRLSGGNSAIVAIENTFAALPAALGQDKKSMAKLEEVCDGDINAVTSALKRYLRKLPDPLIPYSLYDSYIKVGQNKGETNERCNQLITRVVNKLPPANKHALFLIGRHLNEVNYYNNVNRMNFKNLSVVFAPTLARDATGEKEMIDMGPRNDATELLFVNFSTIFAGYDG